ncbi:MAG: hypothetical protein KGL95_12045, partial [Patescibacteria group bacterium]|nr:hypothetical protein [Patescibacteria group bacterium]
MPKNSQFSKDPKNYPLIKYIEKDFDSYAKISYLSKKSFTTLDIKSRKILWLIGKKGPLSETDIIDYFEEKKIKITKSAIQYRITNNKKRKQRNLLESRYVKQKSGISRGCSTQRIYSLTLKGFLASLSEISFENSYMVNKYWEFLQYHFGRIKYLNLLILLAIKYNVAMFLFDNYVNHINLAEFNSLEDKIHDFNDVNPYKETSFLSGIQLDKNDEELLSEIYYRYWLTASIPNLIRGDRRFRSRDSRDLRWYLVEEWYRRFENISKAKNYKNWR